MKFGRVIVELVQMNRRRFVISLDRYIPLPESSARTSVLIWFKVSSDGVS